VLAAKQPGVDGRFVTDVASNRNIRFWRMGVERIELIFSAHSPVALALTTPREDRCSAASL
jgi:hypothetical protein